MKFLNTRDCVLLRSAGVAKVWVAMMTSPNARNDECPNLLMLQLAGKERQGRVGLKLAPWFTVVFAHSAGFAAISAVQALTAEFAEKIR